MKRRQRGRGWSDVATGQGRLAPQPLGVVQRDAPDPAEGAQPCCWLNFSPLPS